MKPSVFVVVGSFAAMMLPRLALSQDSVQVLRAKQDVRAIVTAVNLFKLEMRAFPPTTKDWRFSLRVLIAGGEPTW